MDAFVGILLVAYIGAVYSKPDLKREWTGCYSPQYVEIGETGYVHCQFPSKFNAIYWYENATDGNIVPVLSYSHLVKTGSKYESGEYDILSNGSLVIKNVSIYHERTFKVMCIDEGDLSRSFVVSVQTTVTSSENVPTIRGCNPEETSCLLKGKYAGFYTCRYKGSRPPVQLQWFERSANQEREVESISWSIADSKLTFTTTSNISLTFFQNRFLVALVCQVLHIPLGFIARKELLVDMTEDDEHYSKNYEVIPFPINSRATFQCSVRAKSASYIWKKKSLGKTVTVAFSVFGKATSVIDGFTVTEFGDLVVENVEMHHEGNYTCFYDKDSSKSQRTISLFVAVPPTYPYVTIDECNPIGPCIINASSQGLLTCRVSGIRPAVSLTWSQKRDGGNIRLAEGKEIIITELGLSSVSRTIFYVFTDTISCGETVNLQCQAGGMGARFLASPATEVTVIKDQLSCPEELSESGTSTKMVIAVIVVLIVMMFLVSVALILYQRGPLRNLCSQRRKALGTDGEQEPLQDRTKSQPSRPERESFITHLRQAYDYEKNRNDVYIVSDFSKMDPSKISSDETRFTLLNTYHDLFTDENILNVKRSVIEGEAGCGKSMFGRHVANEWSRRDKKSPLCSFPIFILLSLTNFTKETTIYEAIVDQILPEDCTDLSPNVLESLLKEEQTFILFLDGLDEFSERQEKDLVGSVVHKIMQMKVMRNALVYLLTRSVSYLRVFGDKQLPIFRLELFTSDQRNRYLEKKFQGENEVKDVVKAELTSNKYLASLCKIPFFLNMITDMYPTEHPGKLPTRTMTAFFDKLLQCRYRRHLESVKSNESYPQKYKEDCKEKVEYKRNYYKPSLLIAKFAFDALKDKKGIWETDRLIQRGLGKEVSVMINMKILTEIRENHFTPSQPALIKFAHNMYHNYIAAHHIASIEDENAITDTIKQLDPFTSLHVCIFSCGINNEVVRPVVGYLLNLDDIYPYPISDCICHCLSEIIDYGSTVNSENQSGRWSSGMCFKEQTENLGNNDGEHGDPMSGFSKLLTEFFRRDHGMELRNSDEYYLTSTKSSLLTLCTDKKICVNILRVVNVASQIWDGSIQFDVGRSSLSARIPLIHTCIITDYKENLNEHQVLSLIKDIPTLRELCVFSLTTPRLIKEEIISCLKKKKEENIQLFVIWLTYTSLEANADVFFSYPSTTFKCWMNTLETAIVTIIGKPQDALKMIENNKLKSFAAQRLLKNRKIFGDISEQVAVKIMKDKGLLHFFRHTGFPRPLQKIFMDELRRFNEVLREIMDFWQKLDDASTHEEVKFFSQGLSDKMQNLPFSLRLFLNEEGDLKEDNKEKEEGDLKERTTSNTAENNETVVWQKGRQNIVSFLKPLYFYFQV